MTPSLVLLFVLSQTEVPPTAMPTPGEQVAPVQSGASGREEAKSKAPLSSAPSVVSRSLLAGGAGTLAGGVSLGLALLLVGRNESFDPTFATAALASLMITGVAFALHEALGGRGEITLSFLFTAIVMAGAGGVSAAIGNGDRLLGPILCAAIGSLPAAAAAVFGLEISAPKPRTMTIAFAPTGFFGTF